MKMERMEHYTKLRNGTNEEFHEFEAEILIVIDLT